MMRNRRSLLLWAALLFLAWRLGGLQKLASTVQTGVDAMTGRTAVDLAKDAHRSTLLSTLDGALENYRALNEGQDPKSLQELVDAGFLWSSDLRDEWGRPLDSEVRRGRLVVRGLGRDGQRGTADDWTLGD